MLVKVLLILAIGNSLNAIYSVISRLSSIYDASDALSHLFKFNDFRYLLSIACESSREFFIANYQTN